MLTHARLLLVLMLWFLHTIAVKKPRILSQEQGFLFFEVGE
ncbi:hypothetical protein [Pseudomonas fluorescens]|nr:hypothetical protein [Pseudomonas fluorescens]